MRRAVLIFLGLALVAASEPAVDLVAAARGYLPRWVSAFAGDRSEVLVPAERALGR